MKLLKIKTGRFSLKFLQRTKGSQECTFVERFAGLGGVARVPTFLSALTSATHKHNVHETKHSFVLSDTFGKLSIKKLCENY